MARPRLFRRSMQSQLGNGRTPGTSTPLAQHPARIVEPVRAEIGLQQRELDQIELGAAAADAL